MITNRFDTIYFNGCSFTEGGGFEKGKHWLHRAYKEKYDFIYENEKAVCYPTLIKNKLGIDVINEAKSGSGVDRVVRKVYEYIEKYGIGKSQKTLFILEIPDDISRLDVYSNELNEWLVANVEYDYNTAKITDVQTTLNWIYGPPLEEEYRFKTRKSVKEFSELFINPITYPKQTQYKLLGLMSFLKANNIECYLSGNVQYFELCNRFIPNFNDNNVLTIFYEGNPYKNFHGFAHGNGLTIRDEVGEDISGDGHPGFQSHRIWADGIIDFINKKYI